MTEIPQNVSETLQKGHGGDRSEAAAKNGKKVGARAKGPTPYTERILLPLTPKQLGTAKDLAASDSEGAARPVTTQDVIRRALDAYIRERLIV